MAHFAITVKNKSAKDHHYFLFVDAPKVAYANGDEDNQVFTNVFMSSSKVAKDHGTVRFNIKKEFYAVCGTNPTSDLATGVQVTTNDWRAVKLAQDEEKGSALIMDGSPGDSAIFLGEPKLTCPRKGAFSVQPKNFNAGNGGEPDLCIEGSIVQPFYFRISSAWSTARQFIGLGAQSPGGEDDIIPVATVLASPNTTAFIIPKNTYSIAWGTYAPGTIIDVATVSEACTIDFSGRSETAAIIVHNADGTWTKTLQ